MYKIYLIFAAILCLLSQPAQALTIFACEPEWAALSREIAGPDVDLVTATTGTQDPHHIRARPSLMAAMRRADLVICTGAGLEAGWLPVLMDQSAGPAVRPGQPGYLMVAELILLIDKPASLDRALGDLHPEGNPHIQTDPRNILKAADVLAVRLQQIDPVNQARYAQNLARFSSVWMKLIMEWEYQAQGLQGLPVIVYHDNWAYMLRWLGLKDVAVLEIKPGIPPTPAHLQTVLAAAKTHQAKLILLAPFDNDDAAQWVAQQTGAKIVRLPYTVGGSPDTKTLEQLYTQTLTNLLEAQK